MLNTEVLRGNMQNDKVNMLIMILVKCVSMLTTAKSTAEADGNYVSFVVLCHKSRYKTI